jgi:hypothetical protein
MSAVGGKGESRARSELFGSDEVWFNKGDRRYYLGTSRDCTVPGTPCPTAAQQTAVLGVIDAETNRLIEKIPQSSNSHSVAADSEHNRIFVPQVAPVAGGRLRRRHHECGRWYLRHQPGMRCRLSTQGS